MKRLVLPLVILLAVALAAGAAWLVLSRTSGPRGSEPGVEQRAVLPFSKIVVEGQADVTLVQGPAEAVVVEAAPRQLARVRTESRDGTLVISTDGSRRWWSSLLGRGGRPARITVTFRELDALRATGAVTLKADRLHADKLTIAVTGAAALKIADLAVRELSVAGSGAVKADLAGRATTQKIAISGAGDYRAANLESEHASIAVSGAGRVVVNAEKTLNVALSGAGTVEYVGDPAITQRVSGTGRVKKHLSAAGGPAGIT